MPPAKPSTSTWGLLKRVARLFAPFRGRLLGLVGLILVTSTLDLIPALLIGELTNEAAKLGDGSASRLTWLFGVAVGIYLFSGLLGVGRAYLNQSIGQAVMVNLRRTLFEHLQRLSVRFYTGTRTGEIMSRVTTDVNSVQQAVTGTFTEFLMNLTTLSVALVIMFTLEWRLAVLALAVLPIWVIPTIRVGQTQRRLWREWQEEAGEMSAHLGETLSVHGAMLVRSFGRQPHEAARFDRSNQKLRALSIRRMMAARWFNMATELFGSVSVVVVFWLGGLALIRGDLDNIGAVVSFSIIIQRVFGPFRQIAQINTTVLSSLAVFERIFEYVDLPLEVAEEPGATAVTGGEGRVRFDNVTFAYNSYSRAALSGVSFEAPPGQMVALVGPSGAGKTTAVNLLQRFYDPQEGSVSIDGIDLREVTLDSVSATVGAVMQDTFLFHDSLATNVRYGRLDATDDAVTKAALAAGLGDLIRELPNGIHTVVGERGHQLSGGERQRVAIARAILKDPPVLVLDEATSAMDSRLERQIREAMATLAKGRTTLVIAHRLSTVVAADQILVFDEGRIVERGTHSQLLARGGLYASLYRQQFAHEETAVEAAGAGS
jgi:ATP-binding cassette subfamily B protein